MTSTLRGQASGARLAGENTSAALHRAAQTIAGQAETLAGEIENGSLADRGGPDALRLLAAVVRVSGRIDPDPAGHA